MKHSCSSFFYDFSPVLNFIRWCFVTLFVNLHNSPVLLESNVTGPGVSVIAASSPRGLRHPPICRMKKGVGYPLFYFYRSIWKPIWNSKWSLLIISRSEATLCLAVMNVVAFRAVASIIATIDAQKAFWKSLSYRGRLKNRATCSLPCSVASQLFDMLWCQSLNVVWGSVDAFTYLGLLLIFFVGCAPNISISAGASIP